MQAILRNSWDIVEVKGIPASDVPDSYILKNTATGEEYSEVDAITMENMKLIYYGYLAKDRNGTIGLFKDEPKKNKFFGRWKGNKILTIGKDHMDINGYIFSWKNAKAIKATVSFNIKTDIYREHKKK